MAKNILIFLGVALLLGGALAGWRVWIAPPGVILSTQGDQVVVANVTLGEYFLGFDEVLIRDGSSGQAIWHARRDAGEEVSRLSFRNGLNKTPLRWTLIEPKNSDTFILYPGVEYQLTVWGNNGFGATTKWSGLLLVPRTSNR